MRIRLLLFLWVCVNANLIYSEEEKMLTMVCVFSGSASLEYHNLTPDQLHQLQDALDSKQGK